jgi:Ras-related protein Rab-1A
MKVKLLCFFIDISMPSESESEEFESELEVEIEPTQTRSKTEKRNLLAEKEVSKDEIPKEDSKRLEKPFRRKSGKRKEEDEEDRESTREDDSVDLTPDTDAPNEAHQNSEKRRSKRTKKMLVIPNTEKKLQDEAKVEAYVKQEPGTESEEEQPKGRDFDLNQIRSELKGIEKAVKLSQDVVQRTEEKCSQLILDDKTGLIDIRCKIEEEEEEQGGGEMQSKAVEGKVLEKVEDSNTEDVYEFKEPEPFEFEVRSKRDSLLDERAGKLSRRPRIFDGVVTLKEEKSPRKKLIRSAMINKPGGKDNAPLEEVKKRFRRSIPKKVDTVAEIKRKDTLVADELQIASATPLSVDPVTAPKSRPFSACEEAFDKLCESPSYHVTTKPCESQAPNSVVPKAMKSPELEPLSLFSELPGEGPDDEGEDDSEDRLVISEADETETETEEPLFTYPQRHHEELFPTLVNSESNDPTPASTAAPSKSPEPPLLLPMAADIFTSFGSEKNEEVTQREMANEEPEKASEKPSGVQINDDVMKLLLKGGDDDEYADDTINAAIQRVIEQSMTDEESNDIDIFGGKRPVCSIRSIQQEAVVTPKQEPPAAEEPGNHSPPKEMGKRKAGGRKPVLSKEFVEDTDSDSDSSDEEERLVIAKIDDDDDDDDDDDNMSSSSGQCSLKLHVSESSDFEMKLRLSDRDEDSKTEVEETECKPQVTETSLRITTTMQQDVEDSEKDDRRVEAETGHCVDEGESTVPVKTDEVAADVQVGQPRQNCCPKDTELVFIEFTRKVILYDKSL